MCPLLAPAFQGLASSFLFFFVAAAIDSTNEANQVLLSSLYSLDIYDFLPLSCSHFLFLFWSHQQMDKNIACVNPFFCILKNTLMSMLKHVHKKEIEWKCKEGQVLKCWKITLLRWDIRGTLIMKVIQTNRPKQNIYKQTCERCLVTIKGPRVGAENFVLMNSYPNALGAYFLLT